MTSNTTMPPADAGQLDQWVRPASEARWYCVGRNGIATLCADKQDAKSVAFESDAQWPREAPHRAVQLVDIAALAAERERAEALRQALLKCKTCALPTEVREIVNAALRA